MRVDRAYPRRSLFLMWTCAGLAGLSVAFRSSGLRHIVATAFGHVSLVAVIVTLPGQAIGCLLCGAALFVLRPGVSLRACVTARSLRDAGANLLVFMPGLGDVIGARALVLAGGSARAAITASALDNLAETIAQVPFALLAVVVLRRMWHRAERPSVLSATTVPWIVAGAIAIAAAVLVALYRLDRGERLFASIRKELVRLRAEMRHQRQGLPAAIGLHLGAWAMGGAQLWMAAKALSFRLDPFAAIVIESMAYAVRGLAFFIPAGLAVQEAGLVFAGLAYGFSPAQSLTIALVLRLRDLVFGLALLLWPVLEFRRRG